MSQSLGQLNPGPAEISQGLQPPHDSIAVRDVETERPNAAAAKYTVAAAAAGRGSQRQQAAKERLWPKTLIT